MVKTPNNTPKAKAPSTVAGAGGAARPSNANASSPGSVKVSNFKKRKANAARAKAAAAAVAAQATEEATSAVTAGGDAPVLASVPKPSTVAEASPVASVLKPVTAGEGPVDALALVPKPNTDEASASAPKPKLADVAAATNNGVGADNRGGNARKKNRKERNKERAMKWKGKEKEEEMDKKGKGKGKGKKDGGKKVEGAVSKGGGLIFMCNAQTKPECFKNHLFGLPMGKSGMVERIRPGTKLFLYDFDLKLLYGVYKASSKGGVNLVRNAFNGKFPAQVKFKTDTDCVPLAESSFKHAIKENYIGKSKFDPELNSTQVRRLLALFKPINVAQSAPKDQYEERSLGERHHYEERRHLHQYEDRPHPFPVEERLQHMVVHVPPPEDSYRATRYAPLPMESRYGHSLVHVQDDHRYYQQALLPSESRHVPLGLDSRHVPLALEPHHAPSIPEPRHVPLAYYHHLASSSNDSYYRPRVDPVHERFAFAARTPPRDYAALPVELSARADRMADLYRPGDVASRGAHLQDPYRPGEIAAHGVRAEDTYRLGEIAAHGARGEDPYRPGEIAPRGARMEDPHRPGEIAARGARMEDPYRSGEIAARGARGELYRAGDIVGRADRAEDLYRSDQLVTRIVDLPRHYESTNPAYAGASQRSVSTRANASGVPVSSLYSFAGAPVYR